MRDSIHVLHVDDEPDMAEMVATFLERVHDQMNVQSTTNPVEGLEYLSERDVDCIVSDYDMPGTDGIEFLEQVRNEYPDIPFILYTGKGSEEVASDAISAGVTDYLQKESGTSQYRLLANRITNAVEQRRARGDAVETEQRLQTIAENTADILWKFTGDWNELLFVNSSYEAIWGRSVDELHAEPRSFLKGIHPDDREYVKAAMAKVSGGENADIEFRVNAEEDFTRWVWAQGEPVFDEDGEVQKVVGFARDVTERKERSRRLDTLISNLPGIVYRCRNSPDWPMELIRGECESLTGYPAKDIETGEVVWGKDVLHPDDREELWETVQAALERNQPFEVTYRIRTKDGATRWMWERGRSVDDASGNEPVLEGFITDITERKEREVLLQRERTRLNALFENSSDSIVFTEFVDGEPIVQDVNDTFVETFGYDEDEAIGRPIDELVVPDDTDKTQEATELNRRIEAGERVVAEVRRQTQDGVRDFLLQSTPLELGESNTETYASYSDITDRKERERTLERHETITETAGDPVYALDSEGCFTFVNDAMIEVTGYGEDSLLDEHASIVMDTEDVERGEELIRSLLLSDRDRGTFEMDLVTASGRRIPVENHIGLLPFDETFRGTVGILRDITDRKEREVQLQRQNERLDAFTSVVSHDLRNPLNVASGRLELAKDDCDSEHLADVDHALHRMETLIEDILELARHGEAVGDREPIALTELVETCWANVETTEATLEIEIERTISADKNRLKQVFENLFRNAVEHGCEDVTITVGELDNGFYIEDDGPGIPADEREDIFEAGYSTSDQGTGFGLSIVKKVVEAHGWEITVTEGSDGGARFEITGVKYV